jgi:DNA-binding MarR family transcriptional regulator
LKKASNSNLSHRILITLSSRPASSVTALARDLELLRPSVSRAVNTLQNAGFVTRQGRTLLLTEAGQKEVQRLSVELPAKVKKTADQATRILQQITEQQKQMEAITNSPGTRAIQALTNSAGLQAIQALTNSAGLRAIQALTNSPSLQAAQALMSSPGIQLHRAVLNEVKMPTQLAGIIASIAQIQRINLDILQIGRLPFSSLEHLFIENNVFISRMISDLEVIARVGIGLNSSLEILRHLTIEATKAYDAHFRKVSDILIDKVAQEQVLVENLQMELVIPTTTTSSLVGSTRNLIRAQSIPQLEESSSVELTEVHVYSQQYLAMSSLLEHYLKPLSRRFVSKWHGAWQTLSSESEDRYSQVMHSGRELLMQVLAHLVPDELFTKEEIARNNGRPPTRRMRIRRILDSSSKAEWVDKTAAALDSTYDVLAAESHNRDEEYRDDDTAAGQLIVLGGLLLTLLSRRSNNPT